MILCLKEFQKFKSFEVIQDQRQKTKIEFANFRLIYYQYCKSRNYDDLS